MTNKLIVQIKSIIIILLGIGFIGLENVEGSRLYMLIGVFVGLLILPWLRLKVTHPIVLILDLLLIFSISMMSRYVINYYIYGLYMVLLIEVGLRYELKSSKYILPVIMALTLYHYGVLYYYRPNLGTVSEIIFMFLMNMIIILSVVMIKIITREREKQSQLNRILHEQNLKLEKLTELEVKTHIARDIHDTFGHDMMALIMEIEMADVLIDQSTDQAKDMLKKAKKSARDGMKTIRKVVETLRSDAEPLITENLMEMIDAFKAKVNLSVKVTIDDLVYDAPKNSHDCLYRLVQECMTNAVRHGQAQMIDIAIYVNNGYIHFTLKDDGVGVDELSYGYGLKGMEERIKLRGGQVTFDGKDGFIVKGYIKYD